MRSKVDFYKQFFEQLARRGYVVRRSTSSDYLADIYHKNQLVAFYTKVDTVEKNPFISVRDKVLNLISDIAKATAVKAGICSECPYTDANEKLPNGSYKLAEYNGVVLACKFHHLFDYVFSTYRLSPENNEPVQRQFFYNREAATQNFAIRSSLVDERALFSETDLMVLHSDLVKLSALDKSMTNDEIVSIGKMIERIEDIVPELKDRDYDFNFEEEFRQDLDQEIGG
jgi:hypothetical protein